MPITDIRKKSHLIQSLIVWCDFSCYLWNVHQGQVPRFLVNLWIFFVKFRLVFLVLNEVWRVTFWDVWVFCVVKSLILHPAIITKGTLHQGKGDLAGRICSILCCLLLFSCSVVSDSFVTLDCNLPGSSVHGISQARILEWVAISFSRRSSWPRDGTHVSCVGRQILHHWVTREASTILCRAPKQMLHKYYLI